MSVEQFKESWAEQSPRDFYQQQTSKVEKQYPVVCEEMEELARRAGFLEALIDPSLEAAAKVEPGVFPDAIIWSKKTVEGVDVLRKFAPEFASNGLKLIAIHEKEHLRGPAKEAIGAEERFIKKGEWGNVKELSGALKRIYLSRENQTRLQFLIAFEQRKDLFEEKKRPDIIEALAIETVFCDFVLHGHPALEQKVSPELYREYLLLFKAEFVDKVREKDTEIRERLLKDYKEWREDSK